MRYSDVFCRSHLLRIYEFPTNQGPIYIDPERWWLETFWFVATQNDPKFEERSSSTWVEKNTHQLVDVLKAGEYVVLNNLYNDWYLQNKCNISNVHIYFYNIYIYIRNNVYFCWVRPFCCYSSLAFFFDSSACRKAFTPAKISPGFCIARTWSYGRGKLCRGRLCRWVVRDIVSHGGKNRRKKTHVGSCYYECGDTWDTNSSKVFFREIEILFFGHVQPTGIATYMFPANEAFCYTEPFLERKMMICLCLFCDGLFQPFLVMKSGGHKLQVYIQQTLTKQSRRSVKIFYEKEVFTTLVYFSWFWTNLAIFRCERGTKKKRTCW